MAGLSQTCGCLNWLLILKINLSFLSAKIGRTEDEEDVRREQVELAQKRRKKMGQEHPGGKPLVQTRLHFR